VAIAVPEGLGGCELGSRRAGQVDQLEQAADAVQRG
jgi:hypothetical protein